jgi:hypothetical protein
MDDRLGCVLLGEVEFWNEACRDDLFRRRRLQLIANVGHDRRGVLVMVTEKPPATELST